MEFSCELLSAGMFSASIASNGFGARKLHPSTEEVLRKNGRSPTVVVHLCAWMGVCAPSCKFLEEVWGSVEKCFVVEE